jgi:hypothetical protein
MLGKLLEKQEAVQEKEKCTETKEFPQITKELEMHKLEKSPLPGKEFILEEQKEEPTPNSTNTYRKGCAYSKHLGTENNRVGRCIERLALRGY